MVLATQHASSIRTCLDSFSKFKSYLAGEVVDIPCTVSYLTTYLQIFDVRGFVMTLGDSMTCFLVVMGN